MAIDGQLLQFGSSLIAIFALAGLAWMLGLGGKPKLATDDDARKAASKVFDGFDAVQLAISADGASAILRDCQDQIMVIRRHGNQFAGRILGPKAVATMVGHELVVDSGEARFGSVRLSLEDADIWAVAINQLEAVRDA